MVMVCAMPTINDTAPSLTLVLSPGHYAVAAVPIFDIMAAPVLTWSVVMEGAPVQSALCSDSGGHISDPRRTHSPAECWGIQSEPPLPSVVTMLGGDETPPPFEAITTDTPPHPHPVALARPPR
jgi:hypothetical protein